MQDLYGWGKTRGTEPEESITEKFPVWFLLFMLTGIPPVTPQTLPVESPKFFCLINPKSPWEKDAFHRELQDSPTFYCWIYIMVCISVFWIMINKLKDSYRQGTALLTTFAVNHLRTESYTRCPALSREYPVCSEWQGFCIFSGDFLRVCNSIPSTAHLCLLTTKYLDEDNADLRPGRIAALDTVGRAC